jgi:hypothetical protein
MIEMKNFKQQASKKTTLITHRSIEVILMYSLEIAIHPEMLFGPRV